MPGNLILDALNMGSNAGFWIGLGLTFVIYYGIITLVEKIVKKSMMLAVIVFIVIITIPPIIGYKVTENRGECRAQACPYFLTEKDCKRASIELSCGWVDAKAAGRCVKEECSDYHSKEECNIKHKTIKCEWRENEWSEGGACWYVEMLQYTQQRCTATTKEACETDETCIWGSYDAGLGKKEYFCSSKECEEILNTKTCEKSESCNWINFNDISCLQVNQNDEIEEFSKSKGIDMTKKCSVLKTKSSCDKNDACSWYRYIT